jgi:hypothetical protein
MNIATLSITFSAQNALSKVLHGKEHCDNTKFTCSAKDFIFFNKSTVIHNTKLEDKILF